MNTFETIYDERRGIKDDIFCYFFIRIVFLFNICQIWDSLFEIVIIRYLVIWGLSSHPSLIGWAHEAHERQIRSVVIWGLVGIPLFWVKAYEAHMRQILTMVIRRPHKNPIRRVFDTMYASISNRFSKVLNSLLYYKWLYYKWMWSIPLASLFLDMRNITSYTYLLMLIIYNILYARLTMIIQ